MRVLIWSNSDPAWPGGNRVQREQTCAALRELGVDAVLCHEDAPDLGGYDLVHGFAVSPDQVRRCRRYGLPVVLSTIFQPRGWGAPPPCTIGQRWVMWRERLRQGLTHFASALQGRTRERCYATLGPALARRTVLDMADLLLPNSESEGRAVHEELGVTTPYHVVPNAADPERFTLDGPARSEPREGVAYVARIEPHKNQLRLIRALRGTGVRLLIVGATPPAHRAYAERCRRAAGDNVEFLAWVDDADLPALYRSVKVHALPSVCETTGLSSLEAALCGCNVVTTGRGFARDYFGDMAWYCRWNCVRSIREAALAALEAPFREDLRRHVLDHYTWRHTAEATLEAYRRVLGDRATDARPARADRPIGAGA